MALMKMKKATLMKMMKNFDAVFNISSKNPLFHSQRIN